MNPWCLETPILMGLLLLILSDRYSQLVQCCELLPWRLNVDPCGLSIHGTVGTVLCIFVESLPRDEAVREGYLFMLTGRSHHKSSTG